MLTEADLQIINAALAKGREVEIRFSKNGVTIYEVSRKKARESLSK